MKIFTTLCALLFSAAVSAKPLHNIVVFGDSLSDNGNFYEYMDKKFPSAPYYKGRFTNGLVWIEHVASAKNTELFDYAYGGAGVLESDDDDSILFNLHQEINSYLIAHNDKVAEDSLYVVWIGANNYLAMPEDDDKALNTVLVGIKKELVRLAEKGAKNILVVNLPDLGQTPVAYSFEQNEHLTQLSSRHNNELGQFVSQLKQTYPGVNWIYFDVGQTFQDVIQYPESYGFNPATIKDTCYDKYGALNIKRSMMGVAASLISPAAGISGSDPCDGYLFFDMVHPTAKVHEIMADISNRLLDEQGVQFE